MRSDRRSPRGLSDTVLERVSASPLIDLLGARRGVVCFVGAGGKKSTLYHLAGAHPGRVAVTSTVHIPYFPAGRGWHELIERDEHLYAALSSVARSERRIAFATPSDKQGRWAGVSPALLERVARDLAFDAILVKADGARARLLKAPLPGEPALPPVTSSVVLLASAAAVGMPSTEAYVHRPGRLSRLAGINTGGLIEPRHLVALIASQCRGFSAVSGRRLTPVINMVDDPRRERMARAVAEQVLSEVSGLERVVLTSMMRSQPLVAVVER